jgi:hypothetical protein
VNVICQEVDKVQHRFVSMHIVVGLIPIFSHFC